MDVAIEIDDVSLPVEQLSYQPHIVRVRGFLTEDECNHLVEISKNKLRPCNEISAGVNRTGWGVFLQKPDENNNIIQRIFQRMGKFVPVNNDSEVMQVIRYKEGESTSPHYDFFNPLTPNGAMKIGIYGQRVATVLMYLNNVEEGGTTTFTEVNITTQAVKGDAVIFYNCKANGDPDLQTMHSGDTVVKGIKWLAIKLINQKGHGDASKVTSSM